MTERVSEVPSSSGRSIASDAVDSRTPSRRRKWLERAARVGTSAQAAIPGVYAWSITVAPAAWSVGASWFVKVVASVGIVALITAPLVEGDGRATAGAPEVGDASKPVGSSSSLLERLRSWRGPAMARAWSVWGFVLSSALVWVLVPASLSPVRLDELRGSLGMVGWALFAFSSAGPVLRSQPSAASRIVASTSLKPRSDLPRGDGVYVVAGVLLALSMQAVGWGVAVPERAVLVRLVTVVCGMAVLGATTSIALARHSARTPASARLGLKRALPWLVLLGVFTASAILVRMAH